MGDFFRQHFGLGRYALLAQIGLGLWLSGVVTAPAIARSTPEATPEAAVASPSGPYENGVKRMSEGDFAGAAIQFKNVLQQNQNYLPARIALGHANLRLGNAVGAVKELRIALALGAARDQVLPILGNALLAQRKYDEILDTIKSNDPASDGGFEIVLLRARAHYELGRLEEAKNGYSRAAELAPQRPEPLTGLAQTEFANGKFDVALALVKRALELAPTDIEAWYRQGEFLRALPDAEGALAAYGKALETSPKSLRVRLARASLLLDIGRVKAALDDAQFVYDANPEDINAAFLLWQIHETARDGAAAKAALDKVTGRMAQFKEDAVLKEPLLLRIAAMVNYAKRDLVRAEQYLKVYAGLRPNDRAMRRLLGRVQLLLGDAKSAISSLFPLLKQNPNDIELMLGLGQAYLQTGHYSEATAMLEKASALVPTDTGITSQLALSRVGLGQMDDALEGLKQSLNRNDSGQSAALLLTLLQFKNGDREGALATVKSVCVQHPNDPRARNLLGVVQTALGDLIASRESFEAANKIAPDYVPPVFNLAKLDLQAGHVKEAIARLESIVARNPRSDAALMALADITLAVNDREAALNWLDKAAAAAPDAINTQVRLVEMRLSMNQREEAMNSARRLVDRNPENALAVETLAKVQVIFDKKDAAKRNFRTAVRYAGYDGAQLMRIARQQVDLEDYAEARKTLVKATNSAVSAEAQMALIRLDTRVGDFDSALAQIEDIRKSGQQKYLADILLGELHLQRQAFGPALAAFENAQLTFPSPDGILGVADVLIAQNDLKEAINRLEQWHAQHPNDGAVVRKLALTYLPVGELDKARELHELLLKVNPDDAVLLANLARIYQLAKDQRARGLAEKAQRLAPTWSVALDTLGWILVTEGETAKGLELLRQALARQNNPLTRYHLAQALSELGRPTEATMELKTIIAAGRPEGLVRDAQRYLDTLTDSH